MDRARILSKPDEMGRHLDKIKEIAPDGLEEYEEDEVTRRAIERLLHISIETVIDVSYLLVKELRLGLPTSEDMLLR
jgi:uncharacterized protein YutE (UPF0331/DUF86 family)